MKRLIGMIVVGAVVLLAGCSGDKAQRLQQLEQLEQQNRSGEPMLNDTLAEELVNYFDRHGDANERMRSRYILGRTYYCLDELPRALEAYMEAADCADTTSADCNYKVLSRIHAQSAMVYNRQILPHNQMAELKLAEYNAWKGKDTILAIECFAQKANVYSFLNIPDSVISIKKKAAKLFIDNNQERMAAQTLGTVITPLIEKKKIREAGEYLSYYERVSGNVDSIGNICSGREIYYYVKGMYYLAISELDSAEYMFRKELSKGTASNHKIAAYRGLEKLYVAKRIPDSIAKYADLCYMLNDSVYTLAELQNMQKLQASYNYNHNKLIAEQQARKAEQYMYSLFILTALTIAIAIVAIFILSRYRKKKEKEIKEYKHDLDILERLQTELQALCSEESMAPEDIFCIKHKEIVEVINRMNNYHINSKSNPSALEERLTSAAIVQQLKLIANTSPYREATSEDFKQLMTLINVEIPDSYITLNTSQYTLSAIEYRVTMLIRLHFVPSEISKLTGVSLAYVSNMRRRLLLKIYHIDGLPKEFDQRVLSIR